jgi:hypothetical protein
VVVVMEGMVEVMNGRGCDACDKNDDYNDYDNNDDNSEYNIINNTTK